MRAEKVTPILLCQPCVSALREECVMDAQRHRVHCPIVGIPSPGRVSEGIQTRCHCPFEIRQSPPRLTPAPAELLTNVFRLFQGHEHSFATRVLHVIPAFLGRYEGEGISGHCGVMPIRNIEQKIERVRGLLDKRNREDIGCPFPKHSCGERGWAHADAVWSDTKAGTHLLPPFERDALVYNGQGSVRYGKRDSQ